MSKGISDAGRQVTKQLTSKRGKSPGTKGVYHLRTHIGYTQDKLASTLGVSKGTIERIERVERAGGRLPNNHTVYVLACEYLNVVLNQ